MPISALKCQFLIFFIYIIKCRFAHLNAGFAHLTAGFGDLSAGIVEKKDETNEEKSIFLGKARRAVP